MTRFTVGREEKGQTLAAVVRGRLRLTWTAAKALVAAKRVKLNGQTCGEIVRRVIPGQRIEVTPEGKKEKPLRKAPRLQPGGFNVPDGIIVRHVDDDVVVVEKPAGLTTMRHEDEAAEFGPRGQKFLPKTLADALPHILHDNKPVIAVHRIDKETSGLVVFARNPAAAKHLGRQFRAHTVERTYLAVVRGKPKEGRVESYFIRDRGDGRRGSSPQKDGQRAVTHIKLLKPFGPLSLVECRLETGRTHQVRIHLGELGCPLAGERLYDRPLHGAPVADSSGATRALLHAATLGFVHPATGKAMRWESGMPADMKAVAKAGAS